MSEKTVKYTAELCKLGVPNRNGRIYTEGCFRDHLGKPYLGHLDTPTQFVPVVYGEVSHRATLRQEGDVVMADIETLDTPHGRVLTSLLKDGVKIEFKTRGQGRVEGGVITDYKLFSVDAAGDPARFRPNAKDEEILPSDEGQ